MCDPFIRNHQYNFIKKQADSLLNAIRTNADSKVLASLRYFTETKLDELFPLATEEQKQMLNRISTLEKTDEFQYYIKSLEPYIVGFPQATEKQLLKLFPKNKKLKIPDLSTIDHRYVTYLSWMDIATNKLFMVYHANGQFIGIEGRATPTNKKSFCFVCNRYEELVLFSATSKIRPPKSSPDYYKTVGNYLCMNSADCNKNISDISALEKFIESVNG
ncbi:elongation factor G-binding protein [Paenibacillus ferrarius]|uniref:Elongation factor G-binding protein n=1 Tax=Paenibacillus ferrarius TaxID=1469647 RepID=A0A1V4HNR6_9BACL|nr:FusB/FusC family EF-G-binding protein [Paenibacillus ferrarius]OPH58985.1 elongation factor G-binding protein [Paenibacillus ferrarius]